MTSTYLAYRMYGANLPQTQRRLAAMPEQANLQAYFDQNIGKVKTVDDFLNNYKLFTYAMKANGLGDMVQARALMRKVLISDLNDPNSTANKMNDPRYKQFAQGFNFDTNGKVRSNGVLQTDSQQQDLNARAGYNLAAQLSKVKSVNDLLSNDGLYAAMLSSFGLTGKVTKDEVRAALESDRTKTNTFLDGAGRQALRQMAMDVNFAKDGGIGQPTLLQSTQNIAAAQDAYLATVPHDFASQSAAQYDIAYYQQKMTSLTSVDQIVADPRLVTFIKRAYGIDPFMTTQQLKAVLTSNLSDPKSAANANKDDPLNTHAALQTVTAAFNFSPRGGIVDRGLAAQSTANALAVETAYLATVPRYQDADQQAAADAAAAGEVGHYNVMLAAATSVDDLVNDPRVVAVMKAAYNLPNASASDLRAILTSNLNDQSSVANQTGPTARKFALAYNFRTDGSIGSSKLLQSPAAVALTQANYMRNILQDADSQAQGADKSTYYARKLADATSVDDLLNDSGIVDYLRISYHLDASWSVSDIRNILTGNVSDPTSFVNTAGKADNSSRPPLTLAQSFRATFNIGTDGLARDASKAAQRPDQVLAITSAYAAAAGTSPGAAQIGRVETDYFLYKIAQTNSVDDITNDPRLLDYIKTAFHIAIPSSGDPDPTKTAIRAILISDPNDPNGAAAKAGPAGLALVNAFTFDTSGTAGRAPLAMNPLTLDKVRQAYAQSIVGKNSTADAIATETAYFTQKALAATSVDDITSDSRLVAYIRSAFDLADDVKDGSVLKQILTSNLADPSSYANATDATARIAHALTPSQRVAAAFNIGTDGKAYDHSTRAQTSAAATATAKAYNKALGIVPWSATRSLSKSEQDASDAAQAETDYYNYAIGRARNVDDVVGDARVVAYLKQAYNLSNATTAADLRDYLTSDLTRADSAANRAGGGARDLANAFAFAVDGEIYNQQAIASQTSVSAAVKAYMALAGTSGPTKSRAQAETDYFQSTIAHIRTVDDLLGDGRLVKYLKAAYGLPSSTAPNVLRQVLTSDIKNPKSRANQLGGPYQALAAAFNVGSDGRITLAADTALQTKAQMGGTRAAFLEQAVEADASDTYGDGVRLALYFRAKAPTITSAYQILGDKALTKVVQTALGLSSRASAGDVDSQARYIGSKIKLADFKDPAKLEQFISRFANLYDLQNAPSASGSALFG